MQKKSVFILMLAAVLVGLVGCGKKIEEAERALAEQEAFWAQINKEKLDSLAGKPVDKNKNLRTVLYTDGTLIINELVSEKRPTYEMVEVYAPMYEDRQNYVFTRQSDVPWAERLEEIDTVIIGSKISPVSIQYWFRDLSECKKMDLRLLNTERLEDMSYMFMNCSKLEEIAGLENFNTERVKSMLSMFFGCRKLKEIKTGQFSAASLTKTESMFYKCSSVEELDLRGFGAAEKLTNMKYMFAHCLKLKNINVSAEFAADTKAETADMFFNCPEGAFKRE